MQQSEHGVSILIYLPAHSPVHHISTDVLPLLAEVFHLFVILAAATHFVAVSQLVLGVNSWGVG